MARMGGVGLVPVVSDFAGNDKRREEAAALRQRAPISASHEPRDAEG
jgi:hypothetical protein